MGGVAASGALVGLHVLGGVSGFVLWWAWVLALDGPHLFATVSRTYLDAREWRTRRRLLLGSLGWFASGPLLFGLSAALGTRLPFELFLTFASLWAYWHVVRRIGGIEANWSVEDSTRVPESVILPPPEPSGAPSSPRTSG